MYFYHWYTPLYSVTSLLDIKNFPCLLPWSSPMTHTVSPAHILLNTNYYLPDLLLPPSVAKPEIGYTFIFLPYTHWVLIEGWFTRQSLCLCMSCHASIILPSCLYYLPFCFSLPRDAIEPSRLLYFWMMQMPVRCLNFCLLLSFFDGMHFCIIYGYLISHFQ